MSARYIQDKESPPFGGRSLPGGLNRSAFLVAHHADGAVCFVGVPDEKRDAPDRAKADECVDDPAENTRLSAADPGYKVKLENTDRAPVYAADDEQYQRELV